MAASTLDQFLNAVIEEAPKVKYVATKRMKDAETGEPLAWEIQPLDEKAYRALRAECQRRATSQKQGKRAFNSTLFAELFTAKLATASTSVPNLNNADLQDKYKALDAEDLLRKMLSLPGEYDEYVKRVQEVNGFETTALYMEDVDEAKND